MIVLRAKKKKTLLAIELPDGKVIADGDWHNIDDVMRASHGHGVNRMPGILIEVNPERCDYSWLFTSQCAHCLGHEPDWETKTKVVAYD